MHAVTLMGLKNWSLGVVSSWTLMISTKHATEWLWWCQFDFQVEGSTDGLLQKCEGSTKGWPRPHEEHGSEAKDNGCTQVKPKTHHTSEDWKQSGHSEPGTVPKADSVSESCLKGHQKAGSWSSWTRQAHRQGWPYKDISVHHSQHTAIAGKRDSRVFHLVREIPETYRNHYLRILQWCAQFESRKLECSYEIKSVICLLLSSNLPTVE